MKQLLITIFLLLSIFLSFGQIDSSKLFESSKGKWSLPISSYLSIYDNEKLKSYTVNQFDSTLRIITDSAYQVKAIHDGTVTGIIEIEGEYTLLTNFGNYFIAYSRLTKPKLKKGEFIKVGQPLGRLTKDWTEKNYILEIMLSKGNQQLNAKNWITW